MLTIESANNGRNGVLGFVGAIVFGAAAACFIIFMGGTLGIVLGAVCGTIGLVSAVGGLVANWKQSKSERDMAYLHNAACAAGHLKENGQEVAVEKTKDKSVIRESTDVSSTKASSTDVSTKIISKIVKADGTTSIIEGPLNKDAANNLKLVKQTIKTVTK